jgi:hypothetical protein
MKEEKKALLGPVRSWKDQTEPPRIKQTARKAKGRFGPRRTEPSDEQIEELLQKDIKIDAETKSTLDLHRIEVMRSALAERLLQLAALYLKL